MDKLQLYIYKSLRGFKSVRNINPSENIQRHIMDVRRVLELLDYNPAEKNLFYLISYVDEGSFFTIIRTIPPEPLNHLATTIFVPHGLKITPEEMSEIVRRTTRMVSNPSVTAEELTELHTTFAREYPDDPDAPATVASEGREYAWSLYGGDTGRKLTDYFGDALYQPDFLPYAGVVLVDADLGVRGSANDLSSFSPVKTVPLLPPQATPEGFTPHIYHHLFDKPFLVPLGGDVQVVWKRAGFEDREQTVHIGQSDQAVEPASTAESRKAVSPASFFITSQSSKKPIVDPVITVNGVEINEARYFTQADLKEADVVIRCTGFFPFHARMDLASSTQALIQLQEQRKIYRFELPVKSSELGSPIRFEIHTKRELTDSPIEGYSLLDDIKEGVTRINHLEYTAGTPGASRRMMFLVAGVALLLGLLGGWLIARPSEGATAEISELSENSENSVVSENSEPSRNTQSSESAQSSPTSQAPEPEKADPAPANTAAVNQEAIKYLDSNPKWNKADLEKFPELRGLFDDMNSFRIEKIITVWGPKLKASKNFSSVVKAAEGGRHKPKAQFKPEDRYNKDGDTVINWRGYTYRIDP